MKRNKPTKAGERTQEQYPEAEQVANLLNVIKQHEDQYVLGKIEDGKLTPN